MSRLVCKLLCAAVVGSLLSAGANAQLVGGLQLPAVSLPLPQTVGNLPVAGPIVQDAFARPGAQQAIQPSLDSVSGLTQAVADSGSSSLLELRQLRLQELVRQNQAVLETDNSGQPVRRGVLLAIDPDPSSLLLVTRAMCSSRRAARYCRSAGRLPRRRRWGTVERSE